MGSTDNGMNHLAETEALSFEDCYTRLEQVIERLEQGDLTLEESVRLYEQGMSLARQCGHHLDRAEIRVTELLSAVEIEDDRASA